MLLQDVHVVSESVQQCAGAPDGLFGRRPILAPLDSIGLLLKLAPLFSVRPLEQTVRSVR